MRTKIRIAYTCLPRDIGGAERFLLRLVGNLDSRRFKTHVIFPKKGPVIDLFRSQGIQTEIITGQGPVYLKKLMTFLKKNKINLAQSSHYNAALAIAANAVHIPNIWRIGGRIHITRSDLSPVERKDLLDVVACLSNQIICNSKFVQKQFLESKIRSKVIYNGIEFSELNKYKADDYTHHNGRHRIFQIGLIGFLVPQKRHIDFIKSASIVQKKLPNAHFLIYGVPYNYHKSFRYFEELKTLTKKLSLEQNVLFNGFQENILEQILKLDMVVLPSIDEGGSNAILEAMALGKPVIAADSGSNPEFVKDGQTGLLYPPKDFVRLAEKILLLIKDQKLAEKMGLAARERTRRLFDIKNCICQYEDLYAETVGMYPFKR